VLGVVEGGDDLEGGREGTHKYSPIKGLGSGLLCLKGFVSTDLTNHGTAISTWTSFDNNGSPIPEQIKHKSENLANCSRLIFFHPIRSVN